MPKKNTKQTKIKARWKIIIGLTLFFTTLDYMMYGGIYSFGPMIGLSLLYIRFTFPKRKDKTRIIVWVVISLILLFQVIVEEVILPWYVLIIIFPIYLWSSFSREHDKIYFPVEIQFYNDYFIIYREKTQIIWFTKYWAEEYNKMFYHDVTEAKFAKYPKGALKIYGEVELIRYKYNKDGNLTDRPVFHKTLDAFSYIYTHESPEVDFVTEIERHSPIKITRHAE